MLPWFSRKFSRKLALAFCLTLGLTMLCAGLLLDRALRRHWVDELSSSLTTQGRIIAARTEPVLFQKKSYALEDQSRILGEACACRLTYIGMDGRVLGDSSLPLEALARLENHRERPEVRSALSGAAAADIRHSATVGGVLLYAAVPVQGRKGVAGAVRLALPLAQIDAKLAWIRRTVAAITLGMMLMALLVSLWLSRSISRPLSEIDQVARRLADGEFAARVQHLPSDEFRQLGTTFNMLAHRIQHDIGRLQRLEEVRKDFVANVSHELRTPLATVKAYAETLRTGALDDAERRLEFVVEIEKDADRMTRLVDDLLALSAIESGQMQPILESVSLMRLAAEVVTALKPLAEKRQVVLRLEPFHDIPEVRADRSQMKQVLTNLLDNAVKYTGERGTVRIAAQLQKDRVTVSVSDTGPGVPEEHLPRIFERFYRVDKARSRELGGTGLGLSIVKHIVESHGGSVGVESTPGQGSVFHFTLPTAA